jgi:hypothetical protein
MPLFVTTQTWKQIAMLLASLAMVWCFVSVKQTSYEYNIFFKSSIHKKCSNHIFEAKM